MKDIQLDDQDFINIKIAWLIGSETRYKIMKLIINSKDDLTISEIASILKVTTSSISHETKRLEEAKLIEQIYRKNEGRSGISKICKSKIKSININL